MTPNNPIPLRGDDLKRTIRDLRSSIESKMSVKQNGVGTFADLGILNLIRSLEQLDPNQPWEQSVTQHAGLSQGLEILSRMVERRRQGRFVEFSQRLPGCEVNNFDMYMSQGAADCVRWNGLPLFKSVYDFCIYPMLLASLKPPTIIELGSGNGSSAVWMAQLAGNFQFRTKILSVDLVRPNLEHPSVTFLTGDCQKIESIFTPERLTGFLHPWLVIEDVHTNTAGLLEFFHSYLIAGDYLIVEDSSPKREPIGRFLLNHPGCYKIDTYYTDFFGQNSTSAMDSIFVRT